MLGASCRRAGFASRLPHLVRATGMLPRRYAPALGLTRQHTRWSDRPFPQFAMERCHHFGLTMGSTSHMVCCRECPNCVCTSVLIVEPNEIARIEVDHNTSWLRSSLIVRVESVPPRRYLRWARNARVNLGLAKKGLAGRGDAATILATRRPRSVT